MAGLLEKIRVAALSTAHALLDRIIDMNSVEAVKQYVRDLETHLEKLENSSAEATGYVRTLMREKTELETEMKELDETITLILTDPDPNNDHVAVAKQVELDGYKAEVEEKTQELGDAEMVAQKLTESVSLLNAKHTAMVNQIRRLETMQKSTKAKEGATKAMKLAGDLAASGERVSVDNIIQRIRQQSDVAEVKFDRALGKFQTESGKDAALAKAQSEIEKRKKALENLKMK